MLELCYKLFCLHTCKLLWLVIRISFLPFYASSHFIDVFSFFRSGEKDGSAKQLQKKTAEWFRLQTMGCRRRYSLQALYSLIQLTGRRRSEKDRLRIQQVKSGKPSVQLLAIKTILRDNNAQGTTLNVQVFSISKLQKSIVYPKLFKQHAFTLVYNQGRKLGGVLGGMLHPQNISNIA